MKPIAFFVTSLLLASTTFMACSDENSSTYSEPTIFTRIEQLHSKAFSFKKDEVCKDAESAQKFANEYKEKLKNALSSDDLKAACKEYTEEKAKNSATQLAFNKNNSGFYTAMYIYFYDMKEKAKKCGGEFDEKFKELMKDHGCGDLFEDSQKVMDARGGDYNL